MNWLGLATILAQGLVIAFALSVWWVARRIRRPPRRTYASALARGKPGDPSELLSPREFTEWSLDWRGLRLPVWDIPGDAPSGPVIVCTPGWADSRLGALSRLPALLPHASRVIAWDPPGLGDAPNWPRGPLSGWPMGTREHEMLHAMLERLGDERPVVLFGWSAGGGISIVAAADHPSITGVIAEAPYRLAWTPAFRVLRMMKLPWRVNGPVAFALMGIRLGVGPRWRAFDRAEHASRLRCPLLVLHGDQDEVCPIDDGRAIANAAPRGTLAIIAGGHHNDLWTDETLAQRCADAIDRFLSAPLSPEGRAPE